MCGRKHAGETMLAEAHIYVSLSLSFAFRKEDSRVASGKTEQDKCLYLLLNQRSDGYYVVADSSPSSSGLSCSCDRWQSITFLFSSARSILMYPSLGTRYLSSYEGLRRDKSMEGLIYPIPLKAKCDIFGLGR